MNVQTLASFGSDSNSQELALKKETIASSIELLKKAREQVSLLREQINCAQTSLIKSLRASGKPAEDILSPYLHHTDNSECSTAVKEVAALIIESLPQNTDKLSVTEFEGDITLYWKTYHHTCVIFDVEDQTLIRVYIYTRSQEGKFDSTLEGLLDEQCHQAIAILKEGFV